MKSFKSQFYGKEGKFAIVAGAALLVAIVLPFTGGLVCWRRNGVLVGDMRDCLGIVSRSTLGASHNDASCDAGGVHLGDVGLR